MKTNRKLLHAVGDDTVKRPRKWRSDAERGKLPVVNVRGDQPAPPLPQQGHRELERLIGKQVK